MAGINGKDWIRLQTHHRRGDEEYVSVARIIVSAPSRTVVGEEAWRLAQLKCLNEACNRPLMLGMQCTVLHCTVPHCIV